MLRHLGQFFKNPQSVAIGAGFYVTGFLFGNWATLIPYIKTKFGLSDGLLGLVLLCLPLGAMTFNPWAAQLIRKYSMQQISVVSMVALSLAYTLPLTVPELYMLPMSLVAVGCSVTALNLAVNTTATVLEDTYEINIMSTCHGMFSLGLMTGSLMRSITLLAGISASAHMLIMCALAILITLLSAKTILNIKGQRKAITTTSQANKKLTLPKGPLLTMIIISLCTNVTEGSMADWASVYMQDIVKTSPYFVGWGLFGYSAFMATGRFFGDGIIPVYGRNQVLMYGAGLAFVGLSLIIFIPLTWVAVLGFSMVGLGVSCGAPILYASASRYPDMPDAGGLAVMNTFAMGGFLLGPVVIGFISDLTNLAAAFGLVLVLSALWFYKSIHARLY
jgi:MFS family permease